MKTMRLWVLTLSVAMLGLALGGCGAVNQLTADDAGRVSALEAKISKAEEMDARDCAPEELARARALVEHADHEAREWHTPERVSDEFKAAQVVVDDLYARTETCYQAKMAAARQSADADGDGVPDYKDRCPNTPANTPVDAVGCPQDSDGDGVSDNLDKCPNTPKGAPVDATGCLRDTDGDGLKDGDEVNKYRTNPKVVDTDGGSVNDGLEVMVGGTNPLDPADDVKELKCVELQINFDFDKDVVKPEYYPEVERVAEYLKEFKELSVVIQGHTDNVGKPDYNMDLSLRRSNSVIKLLAERHGIDKGRLSAEGFGDTEPITSNDTEEGRAKNRRIYALLECK